MPERLAKKITKWTETPSKGGRIGRIRCHGGDHQLAHTVTHAPVDRVVHNNKEGEVFQKRPDQFPTLINAIWALSISFPSLKYSGCKSTDRAWHKAMNNKVNGGNTWSAEATTATPAHSNGIHNLQTLNKHKHTHRQTPKEGESHSKHAHRQSFLYRER